MSYKKIAMAAEQEGRKKIALNLLKNEDSIKDQVPILLQMKEYEAALQIAVSNYETDIVYGIISQMRKAEIGMGDIVKYCAEVEGALFFLMSYLQLKKQSNPDKDETLNALFEYYHKIDTRNAEQAEMQKRLNIHDLSSIEEYHTLADLLHLQTMKEQEKRFDLLKNKTPKTSYTRIKPHLELYKDLIVMKGKMAAEHKGKVDSVKYFTNSNGVLMTVLKYTENKDLNNIAEAVAKKQNVDKRQLLMLKLRAAAKNNDWGGYMDMTRKEKIKFPIQYYAETCVEFGNKELAIQYIKQHPSIDDRVNMLLEIE